MKPKFRAPSGPRTPDYAPAARRILFLSLLLLFLLLTMGNLQKSREALATALPLPSCASTFSPTVIPGRIRP